MKKHFILTSWDSVPPQIPVDFKTYKVHLETDDWGHIENSLPLLYGSQRDPKGWCSGKQIYVFRNGVLHNHIGPDGVAVVID